MTNLKQPEIKVSDLLVGQRVRITFKREADSWRGVVWSVLYADERSAILLPVLGDYYGDKKGKIFDTDQVRFWDAEAIYAALIETGAEQQQA